MALPELSVIIVNWNTRELIRRCLESVFKESKELAFEVIVVDNASTDGSVEMLKQYFPQVTVIANQSNIGFSRAVNLGLMAGQAEMVLLLNSDTIILDNILKKMTEFLDRHPEAGIAGCMLLNKDGSYQKSAGKMRSILNEAEEKLIRWGLQKSIQPLCRYEKRMTRQVRPTAWVSGAFLLIKRAVIDQIGMLDERMFLHFEDIDWCTRARQHHWTVLYNPFQQAIHLNGKSMAMNINRSFIEYRRSQLLFYKTYYGNGANTRILKLYLFTKALLGMLAIESARLRKKHLPSESLEEKRQIYKELLKIARTI